MFNNTIVNNDMTDEELASRLLLTWGVLQNQKNYIPVKDKIIAE